MTYIITKEPSFPSSLWEILQESFPYQPFSEEQAFVKAKLIGWGMRSLREFRTEFKNLLKDGAITKYA